MIPPPDFEIAVEVEDVKSNAVGAACVTAANDPTS